VAWGKAKVEALRKKKNYYCDSRLNF